MHTARKWVIGVGATTLLAVGIVFPALDIFGVFSLSTAILGSIVTPLNLAGLAALSGAFLIVPLLLITLFAYYLVPQQKYFYVQDTFKIKPNGTPWENSVKKLDKRDGGKVCRIAFENEKRHILHTYERNEFTDNQGERNEFTDNQGELNVNKIEGLDGYKTKNSLNGDEEKNSLNGDEEKNSLNGDEEKNSLNGDEEKRFMRVTTRLPIQPGIKVQIGRRSFFFSERNEAKMGRFRRTLTEFTQNHPNLKDYPYQFTSLAGTPIPLHIGEHNLTGTLTDILNSNQLGDQVPVHRIKGKYAMATLNINIL